MTTATKKMAGFCTIEINNNVRVQLEELGTNEVISFVPNGVIPKGYRVHSVSAYAFDGIIVLNVVKEEQ
jgi:hypothetical protein